MRRRQVEDAAIAIALAIAGVFSIGLLIFEWMTGQQ